MSYIFFDIDHTLVSHVGRSHIPPETREAVRLLKAQGHTPAIATGRGAFLARTVADELGIRLMVCANGAQIVGEGREASTDWLSDAVVASFLRTAERHPTTAAALDDRFVYTDMDSREFEAYFDGQAGYPCVRPLREMRRAVMVYIMSAPPLMGDYGLFTSPPEEVTLELMRGFVEARRAGTSKWTGIRRVTPQGEKIYAFGDGPNDVEMLRNADVGVAVPHQGFPPGGDGGKAIFDAADWVAEDIDAGGILKACRQLGLVPS